MKYVLFFAAVLLLSSCGAQEKGYLVEFNLRDATGNVLLSESFDSVEDYEAQTPRLNERVRALWEENSWQDLTCNWQVTSSVGKRRTQVKNVEFDMQTTVRMHFTVDLVKKEKKYMVVMRGEEQDRTLTGPSEDLVTVVYLLFEDALVRIKMHVDSMTELSNEAE